MRKKGDRSTPYLAKESAIPLADRSICLNSTCNEEDEWEGNETSKGLYSMNMPKQ